MALRRRGLTQRIIALLIAAAMPLCCCVINAEGSCCIPVDEAPVVEATSCCASPHCQTDQDEPPVEQPPCTDADCSCCLKAPVNSIDWTPPVDTIGTDLPPFTPDMQHAASTDEEWASNAWDDPPPRPDGADAIRGLVILQV